MPLEDLTAQGPLSRFGPQGPLSNIGNAPASTNPTPIIGAAAANATGGTQSSAAPTSDWSMRGPTLDFSTPRAATANPSFDFLKPGPGERGIAENVSSMQGPSSLTSAIENGGLGKFDQNTLGQYWNGIEGKLSQPSNSQQMFDSFSMPAGLSHADAGLGPYYDLAKKRAIESIGTAAAARGGYGSSAVGNQITDAVTNLEADRARNEAQYALQRFGEQRGWNQLGAGLAGQADQDTLAKLGLGGTIAQGVDAQALQGAMGQLNAMLSSGQIDVQRYNAMVDSLIAEQNLQAQRGQNFFGNVSGTANAVSGVTERGLGNATDIDRQLMDAIISAIIGRSTSAANESSADAEKAIADLAAIAKGYGAVTGKGK